MKKFVNGLPGKRKAADTKTQTKKYDEAYLALSFTSTTVGNEERPHCVACLKILASDIMKLNKLRRHLDISHPKHKEKPIDFLL